MKQHETTRPITLQISRELWLQFKETVPRTVRLNDALVKLIQNHCDARGPEGGME